MSLKSPRLEKLPGALPIGEDSVCLVRLWGLGTIPPRLCKCKSCVKLVEEWCDEKVIIRSDSRKYRKQNRKYNGVIYGNAVA